MTVTQTLGLNCNLVTIILLHKWVQRSSDFTKFPTLKVFSCEDKTEPHENVSLTWRRVVDSVIHDVFLPNETLESQLIRSSFSHKLKMRDKQLRKFYMLCIIKHSILWFGSWQYLRFTVTLMKRTSASKGRNKLLFHKL